MLYVYIVNCCFGFGFGGIKVGFGFGFGFGGIRSEETEWKSVAKSVCVVNMLFIRIVKKNQLKKQIV